MRIPILTKITFTTTSASNSNHSGQSCAQKIKSASTCTRKAMGRMTKLAKRLAARTLVVWLEMITAPDTITIASAKVSRKTCATCSTDGR